MNRRGGGGGDGIIKKSIELCRNALFYENSIQVMYIKHSRVFMFHKGGGGWLNECLVNLLICSFAERTFEMRGKVSEPYIHSILSASSMVANCTERKREDTIGTRL